MPANVHHSLTRPLSLALAIALNGTAIIFLTLPARPLSTRNTIETQRTIIVDFRRSTTAEGMSVGLQKKHDSPKRAIHVAGTIRSNSKNTIERKAKTLQELNLSIVSTDTFPIKFKSSRFDDEGVIKISNANRRLPGQPDKSYVNIEFVHRSEGLKDIFDKIAREQACNALNMLKANGGASRNGTPVSAQQLSMMRAEGGCS